MKEKFILENLLNKNIELYFGGSPGERLRGKVVGCDDGVLILEYKEEKITLTLTGSCSLGDIIKSLLILSKPRI